MHVLSAGGARRVGGISYTKLQYLVFKIEHLHRYIAALSAFSSSVHGASPPLQGAPCTELENADRAAM